MFTDPEVKFSNERAYIEYYFDGKRYREYNATKLHLSIFPNKAKSGKEQLKLLIKLKFEFQKALERGWNPNIQLEPSKKQNLSLEQSILCTLNNKLSGDYSRTYKRDLVSISKKLLVFLSTTEKRQPIEKLSLDRIIEFLNQFNTSNRNYMNKRQTLNVLIPGTIEKTERRKCSEQLHEIYEPKQMKEILSFLKSNYPKLHLVALLAYGCFLRPHEESRLLQKKHIKGRKIYLSGEENKGKKVRVVHLPDYVYNELTPFLWNCKEAESFLFSGSLTPLNHDYFKTQWTRAKTKLTENNLIQENQTLYSFRHTGAVNVYRKTKDVHILQQLLGHSDMIVTMKYLRGLGELNHDQLEDLMPEL